jgi:hypothetical protein
MNLYNYAVEVNRIADKDEKAHCTFGGNTAGSRHP